MTDYIDKFNENKNKNTITMSLKVDDKQLLKNYSKMWQKIERLKFDNDHSFGYDDKYIKTKIKTYKESIISNFYNKEGSKKLPREKKNLRNTPFISQVRTIHCINCIIFAHIPKANSVSIPLHINNSNIIKTHTFLH